MIYALTAESIPAMTDNGDGTYSLGSGEATFLRFKNNAGTNKDKIEKVHASAKQTVYNFIGTAVAKDLLVACDFINGRLGIVSAPRAAEPTICTGRLTLSSQEWEPTSDVSASSTLYLTGPFNGGEWATYLWDGNAYNRFAATEISLALGTLANSQAYDVWLYDNDGTATLEVLSWTSSTARATDLDTDADGIVHKSGDVTRRYLGSFHTNSTGSVDDSLASRMLWNFYNRVPRPIRGKMTTGASSWSVSSTSFAAANMNTTVGEARVEFMLGINHPIRLEVRSKTTNSSGAGTLVNAIDIDGTSTNDCSMLVSGTNDDSTSDSRMAWGLYDGSPSLGMHFAQWIEKVTSGTQTNYGAATDDYECGISGLIYM